MDVAAVSPDVADVANLNFSKNPPTFDQKRWMAGLIISKTETAASVAKKYHYKRNYLDTIVRRMKISNKMQDGVGRPRALDEDSLKNCSNNIANNSNMSRDELASHIKAEFQVTFSKRYPMKLHDILAAEESICISRRSLKRYILKLHPQNFPENNHAEENYLKRNVNAAL